MKSRLAGWLRAWADRLHRNGRLQTTADDFYGHLREIVREELDRETKRTRKWDAAMNDWNRAFFPYASSKTTKRTTTKPRAK